MVFDLQDSIVSIVSNQPNNKSFGTGFVIHESSGAFYILTCAHVVRDVGGEESVAIRDRAELPAKVIASGDKQDLDLAVLRVEGLAKKCVLPWENSGDKGRAFQTAGFQKFGNDKIMIRPLAGVLGNQVGVQQLQRSGRTMQAWDLQITDDYSLESGYSGSPVVDATTGNVLGVVSHKKGDKKGIAIAIGELDRIWKIIDSDKLYQILLKLGYREQEKKFLQIIKTQSISAFLIHGSVDHGQRWLLNRLVEKHLPDTITGKVIKIDLSRKGRKTNIQALWRELGRRLGLSHGSPEAISERVYRCWQTQNVLLIFHSIEFMMEDYLQQLIRDFWTPLAENARKESNEKNEYKLLMFLVDYTGVVGNLETIFSEKIDRDRPYHPIKPRKISQFTEELLEGWIINESQALPMELTQEFDETIATILENSEGGIPEYALAEICDRCGFNWYDEVERWWKL